MTMSHQTSDAALSKRLKALEAKARDAQKTIDELKSRDALKTQFLSNISHDLRTPLAAIITHAEILRDGMLGELNQKQRDSVTGIVWRWLFNPSLGVENFLHSIGLTGVAFNWLASSQTVMYGIILGTV